MPAERKAAAPTWTGPALLVPMEVQALPLTEASYLGAWSWSPPRYPALGLLQSVDAAPFTAQPPSIPGSKKFLGVVLHWALPDGLTQGAQQGEGVSYPAIPNRWLVVRRSPAGAAWDHQAWVVASDYLAGPTGSPWPNKTATGATTLGRSWPIDQWPGEQVVSRSAVSPPLTAVGAGDPTFTAFAPNVANIVSIGDTLTGVAAGPLSYAVLGWYSDPADDPLLGVASYGADGWQTAPEWMRLMEQLHWSTGDRHDLDVAVQAGQEWASAHGCASDPQSPRDCYPSRVLCHGSVLEVDWQGPSGPYVSGVPTSNPNLPTYRTPRIALAHSGIDALGAMLGAAELEAGMPADEVTELVEILQAFVHEDLATLDEPDGLTRLSLDVQSAWFDSTGGGTVWDVVEPRDPKQPSGAQFAAPLGDDQAASLTALNTAQSRLDDCARLLGSWQWERYALWWKNKRLASWLPPPAQKAAWQQLIDAGIVAAEAAVDTQANAYRWLRHQRDEALVLLQTQLSGQVLLAGAGQVFARPSDPVLLVNGAGRGYAHGEDGRFRADATVLCRFTGQAVSGIEVATTAGEVAVTATDLPPPVLPPADLPAETPDLLVESFFLDTTSAPLIAQAAATASGTGDPWQLLAGIRREQTLVWNPALHPALDVQTLAEASGLTFQYDLGALPSKLGVQLWSPPWYPLYLDWAFDYFPGTLEQSQALDPWDLPLAGTTTDPLDELTYRWTAGPPSELSPLGTQGRTFLTPQASDVLRSRLQKMITDYADDPAARDDLWALQDVLAYLRNADLLSQALTGFNLGMIERDPTMFPLPSDHSLDPYLTPPGAPALSPDSTPEPLPQSATTVSTFNPIRAGHLKLVRLWVVDAFGQVLKVLDPAGGSLPSTSVPVLGTDLATAQATDLAELKPRITQFARLRLSLLSAVDDARRVGLETGVDPVCGWIIPNHLDDSLLVYEADGTPAGEVLLAVDRAIWFPAPDRYPPPSGGAPPVDVRNDHLRRIVEGIVDRPDSRAALAAMLDLVDTAFWSINPSGGWADEELPVLIGRPLAVVRAQLSLETQGLPSYCQDWPDTGSRQTDGSDQVSFPVQLGVTELLDDGLVGFYLDDDYRSIDTAYTLDTPQPYVQAGRPEVSVAGPGALLTLVMDPSCTVHAISGILPAVVASLPGPLSTPALNKMAVTFRTGPVLDDPAAATMPLPALRTGTWSWLQYAGTTDPAVQHPVLVADATAALPDPPPVLREGWLKLLLVGPPTRFAYAVQPTTVSTSTTASDAATAMLRLGVYNGTDDDVDCEQLTFALPVGIEASDLSPDVSSVTASALSGTPWQIVGDGQGTFTATPTGAPTVPAGATLTFQLAGLRIGAVPGTCRVAVTEVTDSSRQTELFVAKVPPRPATMLTYTSDPVRLPVGSAPTLSVTAYNPTSVPVYVSRLVLQVPVGTGAGDLTADPASLVVTLPGWLVTPDGSGSFAAVPSGAVPGVPPGGSLQLQATGFTVGAPDAPVLLQVMETAGSEATSPPVPGTTTAALLVTKTPAPDAEDPSP